MSETSKRAVFGAQYAEHRRIKALKHRIGALKWRLDFMQKSTREVHTPKKQHKSLGNMRKEPRRMMWE